MALQDLIQEYLDRFRPVTPEERRFIDVLVRAAWRLRRLANAEAQLWNYRIEVIDENPQGRNPQHRLGRMFCDNDLHFARLQRCIDSTERSYRQALRELERLQSNRELPPDPPVTSETDEETIQEIGFVPSPVEPYPAIIPIRRPDRVLPSPIHPQRTSSQYQRVAALE